MAKPYSKELLNILRDLKKCQTLSAFLHYVRDTDGLTLNFDNGWSWLEYKGEEVPNSGKERFVKQSEIDVLIKMARLS